jgi:predicted enzyme related to lactoylglutathione lyase
MSSNQQLKGVLMKKFMSLCAVLSLIAISTVKPSAAHAISLNQKNVAVFFEIPVVKFYRGVKFYEEIMNIKMIVKKTPDYTMAFFSKDEGVSGALTLEKNYKPSADGTIVYLNGGNDLQMVLDRVVGAGGRILLPKTLVSPEVGYIAHFIDTEGNRVGLYSRN